ncbi:MAG: NUDIX hydrolase, partial [Porticoccaceae bacterium]
VTYYRMSFAAKPEYFNDRAVIDPDIDMALWMSLDEIRAQHENLRSPMVLTCIEDYLASRIFPLDIFRNSL